MQQNNFTKPFARVGRWLATTVFCLSAMCGSTAFGNAFFWQGALVSNTAAMANPGVMIATSDAADQVKGAADDVKDASKNIIRGTEAKVKEAARSNASKVDEADDSGSFVEGKAKRDKARIEKRASEDADRTEKAAEKSVNAVKGVVDNIKDVFSK